MCETPLASAMSRSDAPMGAWTSGADAERARLGRAALGGAALDAELVALRVGEGHPPGAVVLAMVGDEGGAGLEGSRHRLVTGSLVRHEVEVHAVLGRLALGH